MTENIVVYVQPGDDYNRKEYGIVLKSATQHDFAGGGIHNRHHPHVLQVWDNAAREQEDGTYLDPYHRPTDERYSYEWSPQAVVISAHRGEPRPEEGDTLRLQDVVELRIAGSGYVLGQFRVVARPLHNPHMVPNN